MSVELVAALLSAALSAFGIVLWFLVKSLLGVFVKRLDDVEKAQAQAIGNLHVNDVETVRIQGRIALIEASHGELDRDIRDIKGMMARGFEAVNARLDQLAGRGGGGGGSGRGGGGGWREGSSGSDSSPRNEAVRGGTQR